MDLTASAAVVPRIEQRESSPSTNAELVRLAIEEPAAWPSGSVLVTDAQTAGRGRLGRAWTAPPGTSLAVSVVLDPRIPADSLGWLPLAAGAAMTDAVRDAGTAAVLKWPNDVLVRGRKVCGILGEAIGDGRVVIGAGLNHLLAADQLPVPTATSLAIEGAVTDPDPVLAGYLARLLDLASALTAAGGDADASGLRALVSAKCATIGREVRAELPGGETISGTAIEIDATGRLVIDTGEQHVAVSAADVTHLRAES